MAESTAGRILVATPAIGDGNFEQSVILMLHHDTDGALGVIINRPTELGADDLLPRWAELVIQPNRIFTGGPVEQNGFIAIGHRRSDQRLTDEDGETAGIATLGTSGELATVDLEGDPAIAAAHVDRIRIFRGYAGWGSLQLDGELKSGAWFTVDVEPDDLWSDDPGGLYERVLRRQRGELRWYANAPIDPTVN